MQIKKTFEFESDVTEKNNSLVENTKKAASIFGIE